MTNAELIKALRCKTNNVNDCTMCDYHNACYGGTLEEIAADALEEAEARTAKLEDALWNGAISNPERFKIYGYKLRDLILFADMCKRNDVREADLKQAAWNLELAVRAVQNERMEIVKKWSDETSSGISARLIPDFEKAFTEMRGEQE